MNNGSMRRLLRLLLLVVLAAGGARAAAAADGALPWKTAGLTAGLYLTDHDSTLRIDSPTLGQGTEFNAEDDLGIDESVAAVRLDGFWRFRPRHRIDLAYYKLAREGSRSIGQTIQIGNQTYTVGTTVNTETDFDVYQGAYSFSFIHDEAFDVAASVGVFVADISASFVAAGIGQESADILAPLPVVGVRAAYAITDDLFARVQGQVFHIEIEDITATLIDVLVGLDYDVTETFGVGVGYNFVDMTVDTRDDDAGIEVGLSYGAATELRNCLDRRNGCGHPNSLKIGPNTVAHHIEILLLNVFKAFQ